MSLTTYPIKSTGIPSKGRLQTVTINWLFRLGCVFANLNNSNEYFIAVPPEADYCEMQGAISFLASEQKAAARLKKAGKSVEVPENAPDVKIFMGQTFRLNPDKNKVYLIGEKGDAYEFYDGPHKLDRRIRWMSARIYKKRKQANWQRP